MPAKGKFIMSGPASPPSANPIELRLRELAQLFNLMDPSLFHERELDPDAEEFIVGWARELPEDQPLSLLVHIDHAPGEPSPQALITEAVHHYFEYRAETTRR